ncbi:MAG: HPr-rel-A system PqqD family peptide chaperone [Actinomycetota bacterium]
MKPRAREEGLTIAHLDQEAVIYDERSGDLHHLNPTATLVFQLLDGSATIKELSADIAEAFGLNPEEVEGQVRSLVRRFRRAGLLDGGVASKRG